MSESERVLDEKTRLRRAQIAEEMYTTELSFFEAVEAIEKVLVETMVFFFSFFTSFPFFSYLVALANAPFKFVTPQKR